MRAKVVAFEGVDGAGKSTVLRLVAEQLARRGFDVLTPRLGKEHRSLPVRDIRRITRDRANLVLRPRAELLLYAAREAQVLDEDVRPALDHADFVLLDRSMLTPVVIAAHGRGLALETCEAIAREASAGLEPDVTLIFDVDPKTSQLRKRIDKVRKRRFRNGGRKGLAGSGFKVRLRAGYQTIAARDGLPVVHAERSSPSEVAARVLAHLTGEAALTEPSDEAVPVWRVDPEASFEAAVQTVPPTVALYFTRRLALGRALRAAWLERDPELVIWACDVDDPTLARALDLDPERVLERLRGPDTPPSSIVDLEDLRERLADSAPDTVARSLLGHEHDGLRTRLAELAPGAVVESLRGRADPFAVELRDRLWSRADAHERAISLRGCDDPASRKRWRRLVADHPAAVLPTLVGLPPQRADAILEAHAQLAPKLVLRALHGRDDPSAHALRRRLLTTGREVVDSLVGLDDDTAWALRADCLERWPSSVAWSLRGLAEQSQQPQRSRAQAMLERCGEVGRGDLFVMRRLFQLK